MKLKFALTILALFAAGCMPLQQYEISGARHYEHLSVNGAYFMEQFGRAQAPKEKRIVAGESYAIGPEAKRYGVEIQPHDYDVSERFPYIRDRIYLLNDSGRRLRHIGDGNWRLFLMLESADGRELREFTAKVWTFNYNPTLHGPPN